MKAGLEVTVVQSMQTLTGTDETFAETFGFQIGNARQPSSCDRETHTRCRMVHKRNTVLIENTVVLCGNITLCGGKDGVYVSRLQPCVSYVVHPSRSSSRPVQPRRYHGHSHLSIYHLPSPPFIRVVVPLTSRMPAALPPSSLHLPRGRSSRSPLLARRWPAELGVDLERRSGTRPLAAAPSQGGG